MASYLDNLPNPLPPLPHNSVPDAIEPLPLPPPTINLGKAMLEPVEHGIAAMARQALKSGVPAHLVIEMLLNHLSSVVAMVEPSGARVETVKAIQNGFPSLVSQHVEARKTTAGGVLLP